MVSFGWQLNLWAPGTSVWIHGVGGDKNSPQTLSSIWNTAAGPIAAFLDGVKVFSGNYKPDFVVFDRYEFDDFRAACMNANYAYDSNDWKNYLIFVNLISAYLQLPAMLWQIPASHLLSLNEAIPDSNYISLHSGAGGTFFMGDSLIGIGTSHIALNITSISMGGQNWYGGSTTVGQWLSMNPTHHWGQPQLQLAINSNVFAILWGGGNTMGVITTASTGTDGGWMTRKTQQYYQNPLPLQKTTPYTPSPSITVHSISPTPKHSTLSSSADKRASGSGSYRINDALNVKPTLTTVLSAIIVWTLGVFMW